MTNEKRTPHPGADPERVDQLLIEMFNLADTAATGVTDAHICDRLSEVLTRTGRTQGIEEHPDASGADEASTPLTTPGEGPAAAGDVKPRTPSRRGRNQRSPAGRPSGPALQASAISVEATLRLIAPDATATPVRARFKYDPAEPYAVCVSFRSELHERQDVHWTMARELLVTGLDEPAGAGDVRVWPWATPRGDYVALALSAPDGNALFEVPRSMLVRFLRRTYAAVPRSREPEYFNRDEWLVRQMEDPESSQRFTAEPGDPTVRPRPRPSAE